MSDSEKEEKMRGNKKGGKMYLNKHLLYKVMDCNGKEIVGPFFKSKEPKAKAVGQTLIGKKIIKNIFYFLIQLNEMIEVSHYPTLLSIGMGLATIDGESPTSAASVFVLQAARNCAIRVQHILRQKEIGPKNLNQRFYGNVIGAGMAQYWESGCKCPGHHDFFFNRLLTIVYGGIGNIAEGILDSVEIF